MDIFEAKSIKPMLIGKESAPFDDPNYLYELKWDGERCLAYVDPKNGTELRNKRNVRMLPKVPELEPIYKQVKKRCILDGELLVLKDGKPDFSEIQRRSLMSDRFRIDLLSKSLPATFVAFDILYHDNNATLMLPLIERKTLLEKAFTDSPRLAVSRYVEGRGCALFDLAQKQELEGVVGKQKDSIYIQDKRTQSWVKMKVMMDDDFVICGYIHKTGNMTSIVLGQYRNSSLIYKGHVTLGVSGQAFEFISKYPRIQSAPFSAYPSGHGNEHAVWLEPGLVCTVKFMHRTKSGGMRQPVFKGLRKDKSAFDCTERQP